MAIDPKDLATLGRGKADEDARFAAALRIVTAIDRRLTDAEAAISDHASRLDALESDDPEEPVEPVSLTVTPVTGLREDAAIGSTVATIVTDADTTALGGADGSALVLDGGAVKTAIAITGRSALDFTVTGGAAGKVDTTATVSVPVEEVSDEPEEPGDAPTGSLALGTAGISDWDSAIHYIDLMNIGRGFDAERMNHQAMRAGGHLDEQGYPIRIPEGSNHVGTIWDWHQAGVRDELAGRYVMTYDGDGDFLFHMGSSNVVRSPGRIEFDMPVNMPFAFLITRIAPGNHPRNMRIIKEEHLALADAGELWRPAWSAIARKARTVRMMPWMVANEANWINDKWSPPAGFGRWAQRSKPGDAGGYDKKGVPVEHMIDAANKHNFNPWFTIPYARDEDYVRQFARMVRDGVNPHLEVRESLGNELWNWAFGSTAWYGEQARLNWGEGTQWFEWVVKIATETALIFDEVWAEKAGPKPKLIHVIDGQTGHDWLAEQILAARVWKAREPASWRDPRTVFHEFAVADYFGVGVVLNEGSRNDLIARINADPVATRAWLRDGLLNGTLPTSIPSLKQQHQSVKAVVGPLKLVAYEGGTHLHHTWATGLSDAEIAAMGDWLAQFSYSEEMGALYEAWAAAWDDVGEGPHMQFVDVAQSGRHGSWGAFRKYGDDTPRSRFVMGLADKPAWWT